MTARHHLAAPLFDDHVELRAVIEAALDGRLGSVAVDDPERPRAARLSLGCYEVFGGDPEAPGARQLATDVAAPCELIYGNLPRWRQLVLEVHGDHVADRPMQSFDAAPLDPARLREIVRGLPEGLDLVALDAAWLGQIDDELIPHALQVFPGIDELLAFGMGFGVVAGHELAAAATSYTITAHSVEVAIATRPAFRGRGLAAVVGARFLLEALATGREPHWNASNPVSQRLARRLGFGPGGVCEVLYLT